MWEEVLFIKVPFRSQIFDVFLTSFWTLPFFSHFSCTFCTFNNTNWWRWAYIFINHAFDVTHRGRWTNIRMNHVTPTIQLTEEVEHTCISVWSHAYNNTYRGTWTNIRMKPRLQESLPRKVNKYPYEATPARKLTEEREQISVWSHAYKKAYRGKWTNIRMKPHLQ